MVEVEMEEEEERTEQEEERKNYIKNIKINSFKLLLKSPPLNRLLQMVNYTSLLTTNHLRKYDSRGKG
jgi:hypothetical protein